MKLLPLLLLVVAGSVFGHEENRCVADLDGDNAVNFSDLQILQGEFFRSDCAQHFPVRLNWLQPPDEDLAGYRVYYGRESGKYGPPIDIADPYTLTYLLWLEAGQWFFAVSAYDYTGNESEFSVEASTFLE